MGEAGSPVDKTTPRACSRQASRRAPRARPGSHPPAPCGPAHQKTRPMVRPCCSVGFSVSWESRAMTNPPKENTHNPIRAMPRGVLSTLQHGRWGRGGVTGLGRGGCPAMQPVHAASEIHLANASRAPVSSQIRVSHAPHFSRPVPRFPSPGQGFELSERQLLVEGVMGSCSRIK